MNFFLNIIESVILLSLAALLGKGLVAGDLQMIVPALVVLLTLGPLIVVNFVRTRTRQPAPAE